MASLLGGASRSGSVAGSGVARQGPATNATLPLRPWLPWLGALLLCSAGCIGSGQEEPYCEQNPLRCGVMPEDAGTLEVTYSRRHVSSEGIMVEPAAFTSDVFSLEDGTLVRHTPFRQGVGRKLYVNPPAVAYVSLPGDGGTYVVTSARTLELGTTRTGRPPMGNGGGLPYDTVLNVSGLSPWNGNSGPATESRTDFLFLAAPDVGEHGQLWMSPGPPQGTTELVDAGAGYLSAVPADYQESYSIDQLGNAWVYQLRPLPLAALPDGGPDYYQAITHAGPVLNASLLEPGKWSLEARLQALPPQPLHVEWHRGGFHALAPNGVIPTAIKDELSLHLVPYGVRDDWFALGIRPDNAGPRLGMLYYEPRDDERTTLTRQLHFTSPFPAEWEVLARFTYAFSYWVRSPYWAEGDLAGRIDTLELVDRASSLSGSAIVPRLSRPQRFSIGGTPAHLVEEVETRAPTVTWDAPATGTADYYSLEVTALLPPNTPHTPRYYYSVSKARFIVDGSTRSLEIPSNAFQAQGYYLLTLTAHSAVGWSIQRPQWKPLTYATASASSGVFLVRGAPQPVASPPEWP